MSSTCYMPFHLDAQGGVMTVTNPDRALVDRVTALVGTVPGERVMRTDYGVPTPHLLFKANADILLNETTRMCRQSIARWEPAAVIVSLNPVVSDETNMLHFDVRVGRGDIPGAERDNSRRITVRVGGTVMDAGR